MTDSPPVTPRTASVARGVIHVALTMAGYSPAQADARIEALLTEDHYNGPREYGWRPPAATEALRQIVAVKDTRIVCVDHGGDFGEPGECGCGVRMDGLDKAQAIARAALAPSTKEE